MSSRGLTRRQLLRGLGLGLGALAGLRLPRPLGLGPLGAGRAIASAHHQPGHESRPPLGEALSVARPPIISRAAWGADESFRYRGGQEVWAPEYATVQKIILHHSVTSNDDADPAATVRAIYRYHALILGWGDMGYNYLVDRFGNIYEGRFGGESVIGAHASDHNWGTVGIAALGSFDSATPSPQLGEALVRLLAWLCAHHGLPSEGRSVFQGRDLPNILAHQEVSSTTCPGAHLNAQVPALRRAAAGQTPRYAAAWGSHTTPAAMLPGRRYEVTLTVRNTGTGPWDPISGKFAHRLGYHWYDVEGNQYLQPPEEDLRTSLPRILAPGQEATISAAVVSPRKGGRYRLQWDLVHEGHTWFAAAGSQPLTLSVLTTSVQYGERWISHTMPQQLVPGQRASAELTLENTGLRTWERGGRHGYRLGYHWFNSQGQLYQQPPEEDLRTDPPHNIAPGQTATLLAGLVAPRLPGLYTLAWDMVHEGYTWFVAEPSNRPLEVSVTVSGETMDLSPRPLVFLAAPGSSVQARTVRVGSSALSHWRIISASPPWLEVSPRSGSAPGQFQVQVNPAGLLRGTYQATIPLEGLKDTTVVAAEELTVKLLVVDQVQRTALPFIPR